MDPVTGNYVGNSNTIGNTGLFQYTADLSHLDNYSGVDYHPEDGWELLGREFGGANSNLFYNHVLLALYNKYAGIVRVFYYIEEPDMMEDEIILTMQFKEGISSEHKTALFAHAAPIMNTVKLFDSDYELSSSSSALASPSGLWVYADFPVAYDPCTCGAKSKLAFTVKTLDGATITLEGTITGTAEQIAPRPTTTAVPDKYAGLTRFSKALNSTLAKVNNGYKATSSWAKSFKSLEDKANNSVILQAGNFFMGFKQEATAPGGGGLKSIIPKVIGAAVPGGKILEATVGLLNFFSGNWKEEKTVAETSPPLQMEIDLGIKLSGGMSNHTAHSEVIIRLPGSEILDGTAGIDAPDYDNVLGVFGVIAPPVLESVSYNVPSYPALVSHPAFSEYSLNAPLQYAINPHANVRPLKMWANFQYRVASKHNVKYANPDPEFTVDGSPISGYVAPGHGPVLIGPSLDENNNYALITSPTQQVTPQEYQQDVVRYSGGQDILQWPTGKNQFKDLTFSTAVLPIEDIHKYSFKVWGKPQDLDVVLKVYAFFVPENDPTREPIMQVFTYKVTKSTTGNTVSVLVSPRDADKMTIPASPLSGNFSDMLIPFQSELMLGGGNSIGNWGSIIQASSTGIVFQQSGNIYAGDVVISEHLSVAPGVEVTIYASNINVRAGSWIQPGIRLVAVDNDPSANQATLSQIESVCTSGEYKERAGLNRIKSDEEEQVSEEVYLASARLFPNPTRTQSTLRYELETEAQVRISLIDVLGQENILLNSSQAAGTQELLIDLSDYPAGLYYCRLVVDGEQQSLPLRIQR